MCDHADIYRIDIPFTFDTPEDIFVFVNGQPLSSGGFCVLGAGPASQGYVAFDPPVPQPVKVTIVRRKDHLGVVCAVGDEAFVKLRKLNYV